MSLVPKEILLSHLQRAEGAEEVTLPIDFFRDLLYQAMPQQRTWVGLTDEEVEHYWDWEDFQTGAGRSTIFEMVRDIEAKLKDKNL
jgi:hypothetical protein